MLVNDQKKRQLEHALRLSKKALEGRGDDALRESLYVSIQVLAHIVGALDAKNVDILADINEELITNQTKLLLIRLMQ